MLQVGCLGLAWPAFDRLCCVCVCELLIVSATCFRSSVDCLVELPVVLLMLLCLFVCGAPVLQLHHKVAVAFVDETPLHLLLFFICSIHFYVLNILDNFNFSVSFNFINPDKS